MEDADDLYGRSKLLGEVTEPPFLTLRTSLIGRELSTRNGLVDWFLANRGGHVRGFRRAVFSGLTSLAFADLIGDLIDRHAQLAGLYHVSSAPMSKYELLKLVRDAWSVPVEITADDEVEIDRSLDSSRFRRETAWQPQDWPTMIREMSLDPTPYDQWH